jgi:hypothetical protein
VSVVVLFSMVVAWTGTVQHVKLASYRAETRGKVVVIFRKLVSFFFACDKNIVTLCPGRIDIQFFSC